MEPSTEQKIVQAARKEFIETGLSGARMQRIAERAGVNKALLHYYFRSKEKLYEAALRDAAFTFWETVEAQIPEIEASGDLKTLLRTVVGTFFRIMSANPDFPKMFVREIADGATTIPILGDTIYSRFGRLLPRFQKMIQKELAQENTYPFDPVHLLINVIGMCMVSVIMQPVALTVASKFGKTIDFNDVFYLNRIESIVELVSHGIYKQDIRL
ncbi:MAG TPA: TetR/AcrR family transcriptional regulator [Chitinispirillaceae bacterium]|nr:TetR/AcrR family transcriptional regulator [Chitinispirillaceae bacterium]